MMQKDELFQFPTKAQFSFDASVAGVFDDMIERSVPYYREILDICTDVATRFSSEGDRVLDLGCSTATMLLQIDRKAPNRKLIGMDNSAEMLKIARQKAKAYGVKIKFEHSDIKEAKLPHSMVILSNFTLQFIRPPERPLVVRSIYNSLEEGGVFIFSEKTVSHDKRMARFLIDRYHAFKLSQGYSQLEIMRKREALENVLVPFSAKENESMCKLAGFTEFETIFCYGNFASFVAMK